MSEIHTLANLPLIERRTDFNFPIDNKIESVIAIVFLIIIELDESMIPMDEYLVTSMSFLPPADIIF
jgi:hypothetical protein